MYRTYKRREGAFRAGRGKVGRASEKAFGRRHVSRALHDDHKEVIRQKFQRSCFKQKKSWILQGATGSLLPLSAELQEEC